MLEIGTVNLLCSGPGGGKTTLTSQAILAQQQQREFFIPALQLPAGPIAYVCTDRPVSEYWEFCWRPMGVREKDFHPMSLVSDRAFNPIARNPVMLRAEVARRIAGLGCKTLVLDLYGEFVTGRMGDTKELAHDGRLNVQWAQDLGVAILALPYTYKQKEGNSAKRVQDRIAGGSTIQASCNWKLNLISPEETKSAWQIHCVPSVGRGAHQIIWMERAEPILDPLGRFGLLTDVPAEIAAPTISEIEVSELLSVLSQLSDPFEVAESLIVSGWSRATAFRKITKMLELKLIEKVAYGVYRKLLTEPAS